MPQKYERLPHEFNERTIFSDECYGVIGRALTFANRFESNCKALAILLKLKTDWRLDSDKCTDELSERVSKLYGKPLGIYVEIIRQVCEKNMNNSKEAGITELQKFFTKKLKSANKARIELVHELTRSIEDEVEDDNGRANIIKSVETLIREIAEVDLLVFNVIRIITKEPPYLGGSRYCEEAVKWVCEIEDTY